MYLLLCPDQYKISVPMYHMNFFLLFLFVLFDD